MTENEICKCKGKLNFYDWSNPLAPRAHEVQLGKRGSTGDEEVNLKLGDLCVSFGSSVSLLSARETH